MNNLLFLLLKTFNIFMNEVFIIIGLILLNGVFAMSEVALISARKSRLSADAKNGNKCERESL